LTAVVASYAKYSQVPESSPGDPKASSTSYTPSQDDLQPINPFLRLPGALEGEKEEQVPGSASVEL
jgi:hypothetical protein